MSGIGSGNALEQMRGEREVRERGGRTPVDEALERAAGRDNDGGVRSDDEGGDSNDDYEEREEGGWEGRQSKRQGEEVVQGWVG